MMKASYLEIWCCVKLICLAGLHVLVSNLEIRCCVKLIYLAGLQHVLLLCTHSTMWVTLWQCPVEK